MQQVKEYHKAIVDYYDSTQNAYKDAWDLDNSHAIHYGYSDDAAKNFRASLLRMNEVMMELSKITNNDKILDAGCGIGGSSIYIAKHANAFVTGISLSGSQVQQANELATKYGLEGKVKFQVADYCKTPFADGSFDVVWGCESICYAHDKGEFIKEAFRLLKPGGRLIVADGFVTKFDNNDQLHIRRWLDGWQVNYLETPQRFTDFMKDVGFATISFRNITQNVMPSAKRLNGFYYLANLYIRWRRLIQKDNSTQVQRMNIRACRDQYLAIRKKLWLYGIATGVKPT